MLAVGFGGGGGVYGSSPPPPPPPPPQDEIKKNACRLLANSTDRLWICASHN